uniref:Eukaryotic translation initiation factor 3 subunit E n=1 Tax=Rhizochromulina marina TaxID=1034831 RepID=A0A7S2SQG8_9STRA|mmetsp:Transcript_4296/g.12764  ORF Transcript_4296/g.12764 Transcript_4296/m.12764 type:complete len:448 (+) Transcript_4296:139-1482(+)
MATPKPASEPASSARYDLTPVISEYLDLHLMFPLLEFVESNEHLNYDKSDIQRARLAYLKPTNMVDYAIEIFHDLNPEVKEDPADMVRQRDEVYEKLGRIKTEHTKLSTFFQEMREGKYAGGFGEGQSLSLRWIQENIGVDQAGVENYYRYGKFQYECGLYEDACTVLSDFLSIDEYKITSSDLGFAALWGKFAALILQKQWDAALAEMQTLKKAIDERTTPDKLQLQQRTWLLHWSLFVFFNHHQGRDLIIEAFLSDRYLQAIQINAPWLLRYLTSAVIINQRRRGELKALVRVIEQEQHSYSDPITKFLECLRVDFDFEGAQQKLVECTNVLLGDYFLCNCTDEFVQSARLFIFETYCRIHRKIDISMLAEKLVMEPEDAEQWIVNLIRGAQLDAKIDSKDNCVIMGSSFPSVYQQIVDKTKDLTVRSFQLATNVERATEAQAMM